MNDRNGWKSYFSIYSVQKRVFLLSKIVIGACLLAYIIASLFSGLASDLVFLALLLVFIFGWDFILGRIIAQPIEEIGKAAQRMADLDFSKPCRVNTKGELHTLADNLNTSAANLQNALAQRKELTDTLSHEMKTPLGVIRAYAEGLNDAEPQKQMEYTQTIIEETEKMAEMVNSLLDLSALEAGATALTIERFDLVELVETVAGREYLDFSEKQPYQLGYTLPPEPVYVLADPDRLRQVLHNLMGNAKKFVDANGNIHIAVQICGSNVRFSVYNDGPFVTDEVWGKFYRDKGVHNKNGSGLGLAIASQILSMHKATYGFQNRQAGPAFYFELPVCE